MMILLVENNSGRPIVLVRFPYRTPVITTKFALAPYLNHMNPTTLEIPPFILRSIDHGHPSLCIHIQRGLWGETYQAKEPA